MQEHTPTATVKIGVVMGSDSDWPTMQAAAGALAEFEVPFEVGVVSAHRTPQRMLDYAAGAAGRGISVIIAGAGRRRNFEFKLVVGPGDQGEPVITIMLPGED